MSINGTPVSTGGAAGVSGGAPAAKFVFSLLWRSIRLGILVKDARATCVHSGHLLRVCKVRVAPSAGG